MHALVRRPFCLLALALILMITVRRYTGPPDDKEDPFEAADGMVLTVTGRISGRECTAGGFRLYLDHLSILKTDQHISETSFINLLNEKIRPSDRLLAFCDEVLPIHIGCRVTVSGACALPGKAKNPGQFDAYAYSRARGIRLNMSGVRAGQVSIAQEKEKGIRFHPFLWFKDAAAGLRIRLREGMRQVFREEDAALLAGAVLGDRSGMDPETLKLYRDGGIAHILSASALPVTLLGAAIYRLLRRLRRSFLFSASACGIVILFCMELAGASPGAVRAALMFLIWLGAQAAGRTNDRLNGLGAAAFFILSFSPGLLFDLSFILSFTCILSLELVPPAIGRLYPGLPEKAQRLLPGGGRAAERILASLSLQLGTLPVLLWYFYQVSPYAFLLNLLALPCMSMLLGLGLLGSAAGTAALEMAAAGFGAAGAGFRIAGRAAGAPCRTLLFLFERLLVLERFLPGSVTVLGRPSALQIVLYYAILLPFLFFLRAAPGALVRRRLKLLRTLLPVLFSLLLFLITLRIPPHFRCTFLDVGQGSCCLVEQGRRAVLFDAGSSTVEDVWTKRIEPSLRFFGIRKLDAVILSHGDADHINGIMQLMDMMPPGPGGALSGQVRIDRLLVPDFAGRDPGGEEDMLNELISAAALRGIPCGYASEGDSMEIGEMDLAFLAPARERLFGEMNQDGIVLLLTGGRVEILFMGDLEKKGEKAFAEHYALKHVFGREDMFTVLSAGHHGSRFATSEQLLDLVRPDFAVISCGKNNRYGHPAPEVLERLKNSGAAVKRTDLDGAVTVEGRQHVTGHTDMCVLQW